MMKNALFYIQYENGRYVETEFETLKKAERAYNKYHKNPELDAKAYGWEGRTITGGISQMIRAKKKAAQ